MLKRKTHNKSRRGCQSCKKRHIKCDEKQPQCINCVVRGIACIYQLPLAVNSHFKPPKSKDGTAQQKIQQHGLEDLSATQSLNVTTPPTSLTPFSSTVESNRLLELELMHQWSTKTWRGLYSVPEDQDYLQTHLPRAALSNSYLLNIILATAASDLAGQLECGGEQRTPLYHRAALQYWHRAIEDYRPQLKDQITEQKAPLLYHFAVIEAICRFSMPRASTTLDRLTSLLDMIVGTYTFLMASVPYLPMCFRRVIEDFDPRTISLVDQKTEAILNKLTSISCLVQVTTIDEDAGSVTKLACNTELYRIAIAHIKHCFAEDASGKSRRSCFSMVSAVNPQFFQALKQLEPMALIILLFYGVLFHRTAADGTMWWLGSAGSCIVEEISELLSSSLLSECPDAIDVIAWTRGEVGLPAPN